MSESTHVPSASGTSATLAAESGAASSPLDPATARSFHSGVVLEGRYRLVARIGKGGMGEVWEAEHTLLGRTVAIKLVLAESVDVALGMRLQREAELVARLDHPNIVAVTDFGLVSERQPFVVMERLSGRTLSQLLRERGTLPWTQARDIAVQIAAGLACAHEAGIVHRDLKPSNVFVLDDPHGRLPIKIIDFGLAKATQLGPGDRALTNSGAVFGTPAYMAPEQVRGEPLDGRVDVYALGAILYEMIVGERLWQRGTVPQLLYCHLFEPAPTIRARMPDVPHELDALVARCLCKDPAMRPSDADALRLELVGVGASRGATLVMHETLPVPPPEVRTRYATRPAEHATPIFAAATPSSAAPRWIVPTMIAGVVVIAALVAVQVATHARVQTLAEDPEAPLESTPTSPRAPVAPTPTPTPARAAAPSDVVPIGTPASVEPSTTKPAEPALPPSTAPPSDATTRTTGKPRARSRRATPTEPMPATTPTTDAATEPADREPNPPAVPRRRGETLDWPTK